MSIAYLSSAYLAPIQYYQKLLTYNPCYIEQYDHYSKQTYRNRCYILGAEGVQCLTIPIIKPLSKKAYMKDIQISDHGNWQHLHWNAILSAYNNSPYFEYYESYFAPFYTQKQNHRFLLDYNTELQNIVCELIDTQINWTFTKEYKSTFHENELDFRESIHPKNNFIKVDPLFKSLPYYQVFQEKHGFIPNLSIIDLLFHKGPESIFYLDPSLIDQVE